MPILTKEQFESLAKFDNTPAISIYMPTQRMGKDVLEEKASIQLKTQWKKAYEDLKKKGYSQEKINKLGEPVVQLMEDKNFWRHQSDGLAIFVGEDFFEKFTLPINFQPFTYISDHFYLKPLVPMFNEEDRFYLLSLQKEDNVQLYEATRYTIGKVDVDDLTPDRLQDRVGYDYEEKHRKHKTQRNNIGVHPNGVSTQHGYDAANRDEKNEILRFFRAVDKGIYGVLNTEDVPLLVACDDSYFPIYQEASRYKYLYPKVVPGNPAADYENIFQLHAAALDVLEPYLREQKEKKMEEFRESNPAYTSTQPTDIIPAIYEGKVDTLFLQNMEDIWGRYDEEMATVEIHDERQPESISLMNLAAVKVVEQGGTVYLIERQFMPDKNSKMNAVFRY